MSMWKIWLGTAIIFISGALAGGVADRMFIRHSFEQVISTKAEAIEHTPVARLVRRLDLTPEEQDLVRPIVEETAVEILRIRMEQMPRLQAIMESAVERMKPLLPPDKADQMDVLLARSNARLQSSFTGLQELEKKPPSKAKAAKQAKQAKD